MNTRLILEDGTVFRGRPFGAESTAIGEVVFNTAMTGYQEILTDPSYYFQMIVMTAPQIGNYGINPADMESRSVFASGLIVREHSPVVSHWQAKQDLTEFLRERNVAGISGIDTRALTARIRSDGAMMGMIVTSNESDEELLLQLKGAGKIVGRDLVRMVTADGDYQWDNTPNISVVEPQLRVAVYDFGVKYSILRLLAGSGCKLHVFPAGTPAETVLAWKPDGVFLSNGPGDPEPLDYAVKAIRGLLGTVPVFGICLGHQLLGLALDGRTSKLKFGHHGANHPVRNLKTGRIEITSQNHGFVVDMDSLDPGEVEVTHINLNDGTLEGFRHRKLSAFSVQYHPEAGPGPHDSRYLFTEFLTQMKEHNAQT